MSTGDHPGHDPSRASVYVHIPYCVSKCWYCDFNSHAEREVPERRYTDALIAEWRSRRDEIRGPIPTLYFGGGTPSVFMPESIARVIAALRAEADFAPDIEITLEANPGTVESARMAGFAAAGVNRVSMGAQSLSARVLKKLGRTHAPDDVPAAVRAVREAGITNLSVDLMFGIPDREPGELERDLEGVAAFETPHVSAYCLTVYEETPFGRDLRAGRRREMDTDDAADEFEGVVDFFASRGLLPYEIANFAQPGFESRHNSRYWQRAAYIGLGAGAHSFIAAPGGAERRFENERAPEKYMARVEAGEAPIAWEENPTPDQALGEAMFLGLRRALGVDAAELLRRYGVDIRVRYAAELAEEVAAGRLEWSGNRLRLTRAGVFVSDDVFCRFV